MLNKPSAELRKATGRDVGTGKVITLTKTQPVQLSLFGEFLPPEARDSYSNTIELYDAIPKYYSNKQRMAEERQGGIFHIPLDLVVDQWPQKVRATRTAIPCCSTTVRRRFVA